MDLQITKWGNSLALRIPADVARQLGLKEGSDVKVQLTPDGSLSIRPARWDRTAFCADLAEARSAMPMRESVLQAVRSAARY